MLKLRTFSRIILLAACLAATQISLARDVNDVRLLYWNIQNGMWADQQNNYNNFVDFVKSQDPDICVWCEGASIYYSGTADYLKTNDEKYLPYNWDELAARYGHNYVYVGGWRDDYPQVVTSKFPIKNVKRILGNPDDVIVSHGAGWVQIEVQGQTLNLVTLHTWPHQHAYMAEDQEKSKAENGGHKYRAREMKFICDNTINTVPDARNQYWMMMGDFNARSRVDAAQYDYPEDSPAYLVHDYIKANTPYRDVIASWNGKKFVPSVAGGSRIDFIYATAPMVNRIRDARIYPMEGWLKPVRDPKNL
ncbi:MAG: endonuclease, partial [Bacteroidales bacterium]|nr:endonuclease [Candidatus Egerieousia equi]